MAVTAKLLTFASMNYMWAIIFFLLPLAGAGYALWHIWNILPLASCWRWGIVIILALCFVIFILNFVVGIDKLPMSLAEVLYETGNSSLFILLYVAMLFGILDLGRAVHLVPKDFLFNSLKGTVSILVIIVGLFTYGYFHYLDKVRQPIMLKTSKKIEKPLKIVMISDLHLGYHNRVDEFRRWVGMINAEHPDLVLIGGDIIDGSIRAIREQHFATEFRKINAPIYACLGNHEYYSGEPDALKFYKEANIHLLIDSVATVQGVNIIGRDDRTNRHRKSLNELVERIDKSKYTILLDHQPYNLEQAEQNGIDFQLSGHTHYGQIWPISWIEDAIYEDAYGPLTKSKTQYFVTSGIGIWGAKFRIGTRSEYLVATLK